MQYHPGGISPPALRLYYRTSFYLFILKPSSGSLTTWNPPASRIPTPESQQQPFTCITCMRHRCVNNAQSFAASLQTRHISKYFSYFEVSPPNNRRPVTPASLGLPSWTITGPRGTLDNSRVTTNNSGVSRNTRNPTHLL